jgi:hypothetical protein
MGTAADLYLCYIFALVHRPGVTVCSGFIVRRIKPIQWLRRPCCVVLRRPCCVVLRRPCCVVLCRPCCVVLRRPCCVVLRRPCCVVLCRQRLCDELITHQRSSTICR